MAIELSVPSPEQNSMTNNRMTIFTSCCYQIKETGSIKKTSKTQEPKANRNLSLTDCISFATVAALKLKFGIHIRV